MKTIYGVLVILTLMAFSSLSAQESVMFEKDTVSLEDRQIELQLAVQNAGQKIGTGAGLMTAGIVLGVAGVLIPKIDEGFSGFQDPLMISGGVLFTVGTVYIWSGGNDLKNLRQPDRPRGFLDR